MTSREDLSPSDPTPEQAIEFRDLVHRIQLADVPDDEGVVVETLDGDFGLTLEDVLPEDNEGVARIIYTDFKLTFDGFFEKHVTGETTKEKKQREISEGDVARGALTRTHQSIEDIDLLTKEGRRMQANQIGADKLNERVDLGRVSSVDLQSAMDKARRILEDFE